MKIKLDEAWLRRMAELEDNCDVSVGGDFVLEIKQKPKTDAEINAAEPLDD